MPLYEFVLRFPDRDETRITDRAVSVGETIMIANRRWTVIAERPAQQGNAAVTFLCDQVAHALPPLGELSAQ